MDVFNLTGFTVGFKYSTENILCTHFTVWAIIMLNMVSSQKSRQLVSYMTEAIPGGIHYNNTVIPLSLYQ